MMCGLLLGMVLSVCTYWFHNMVTLPTWLVSTDFGTCSYKISLSNFTPFPYMYLSVVECTLYQAIWWWWWWWLLLLLLLLLLNRGDGQLHKGSVSKSQNSLPSSGSRRTGSKSLTSQISLYCLLLPHYSGSDG
jgi:hypothetical protein